MDSWKGELLVRRKLVSEMVLALLFVSLLPLVFSIQPCAHASVPTNYSWIHGNVYKNHTLGHPLRGILLELWDDSSNTLVSNTISLDSDVDPGAFDFGYVYTEPNRTFFIRILVDGYNSTGYNMLDVIDETTRALINYDSPAFTCYSGQNYYYDLYGPNEGDPTTLVDQALNHYYYIWLVYDYFRKNLDHHIKHVTVHILPSGMGAWASTYDLYFPKGVNLYYYQAFGHEYGHSIMFQTYYPQTTCNSTQGHSANHADVAAWDYCQNILADPDFGDAEDPVPCSGDALSEGWAHFVPLIAYGAYIYTGGPPWSGMILDVRQGAGEKNEFGFTGILHDIYNIPGQNSNTMLRYIWEVLSKDHPGSVVQFYNAFTTRHPELAEDVKIAYMRRFAVFSRIGIEVKATESGAGIHVGVSGYLMPFPHPNKIVTVNYRMVGTSSWTWLADVTTDDSSFYSVTADLHEGVYEFQSSWPGDRDHHTGHHGSTSDIARTDEHYIASVNDVKIFTNKKLYYPGETVQIEIQNRNYSQETVINTLGTSIPWPLFYNYSYADFYLQILYPDGTPALNKKVLVPPFYGTTCINLTDTMMGGRYNFEAFDNFVGSIRVSSSPTSVGGKATQIVVPFNKPSLLAPHIGLTTLLAVATATVVYVRKRKKA